MPFIHPAIFWTGLGAASAPIIIHLLNRRRFRIRDWAAMQFLLESVRKNRRRLRMEELLLLLMRVLVIVLLAAAVSRFTGCEAMSALPGGKGARTIVYVLDDSYSMGQKLGAGTLLSAAAADLAAQIQQTAKTNEVAIFLTPPAAEAEAFFKGNVTDPQSLVEKLKTLKPADRRADLADALRAANKTFQASENRSKRLYVLGDFRRADLASSEAAEAIRRQFTALKNQDVEVIVMDYGRAARSNLTVQTLELLDKFVVAKRKARLRIGVRNHGQVRAENVKITLTAEYQVAGETVKTQPPVQVIPSIEPSEVAYAECFLTIDRPGPAVITAKLGADELPGDNAAQLALKVRQAVKILVVDGQPDLVDPIESESFFFLLAVDPAGDGSKGNRPELLTRAGLSGADFDEYDLVVLMNLSDFPAEPGGDPSELYPKLAALEKYVREGGGLAIFTGGRVSIEFYKTRFYNNGAGLLPYRIRAQVGKPDDKDTFFRLDPKGIAPVPMLRCFRGEWAGATKLVRFFAFHKVEEVAGAAGGLKPPRVLARFTDPDNSPAIVARPYGKGNVLTFYTTGSARWTDWATELEVLTYVYVMNDMLEFLARREEGALTAPVGEPITYELGPELREAKASLKTPQFPVQDLITLAPEVVEGKSRVQYERAADAGRYTLQLDLPDQESRQVFFARNVDPDEGDLTCGHRPDIQAAFGSSDFRYFERSDARAAGTVRARVEEEYWTWAIAAMFVLMGLETFFGQRFGHYSP